MVVISPFQELTADVINFELNNQHPLLLLPNRQIYINMFLENIKNTYGEKEIDQHLQRHQKNITSKRNPQILQEKQHLQ